MSDSNASTGCLVTLLALALCAGVITATVVGVLRLMKVI